MTNQNQAGTKLCGRFVLIEKLGAGGYGEVWRARDEMRDTEVALKILYSQFLNSDAAWEVFQREFTLTARLNHPGVLRVYEPVRAAEATVLPMVFAAGGDLRQMRGAPYTKILPLLIDIAAALEHAHSRRIVHRDLKPSNILLDGAGRPLLADFGAGASEGDNSSGPPGSPFSASPQQLAGEPARPTDDIYGLGALAYELLSGYPPFYPAFDAKKIATEPVPRLKPVKPIPPRLELLVSWLLAKQGRERPPSMRHVADEMNAVLQDTLGLEGSADRRRRGKRSRDPRRRRRQPHAGDHGGRNADARELGARARRNRSGHVAAGRRAARAGHTRAARAQSPAQLGHRRGARLVAGGAALLLPKFASEQKVDLADLQLPAGPTEADQVAEKRAEELTTQHTELSKRLLELDSHAAAQWGGTDFAAARKSLDEIGGMLERRKYESAPAPLAELEKSLAAIEAKVPEALTAQITEGKRALNAGEFENARQAFDTALKIDPQNQEATEWLGKVAAASGVVPTLADAENAEAAKRPAQGADLVRRRAETKSRQRGGDRRPRAREARRRGKTVQCGDGRRPGRAQRRTPRRGAHASRTRAASSGPTAPKSAPRCSVSPTPAAAAAPRNSPSRPRAWWPRNAGPRRWLSTTKRSRATRHCSSRKRAARRSRRGRNWAIGCRHSSKGRNGSPRTKFASRRKDCWRAPGRCRPRAR